MDDIVDRLRDTAYESDLCWEAAAEIERLRGVVQRQGMELLVAHSENLGLYDDG